MKREGKKNKRPPQREPLIVQVPSTLRRVRERVQAEKAARKQTPGLHSNSTCPHPICNACLVRSGVTIFTDADRAELEKMRREWANCHLNCVRPHFSLPGAANHNPGVEFMQRMYALEDLERRQRRLDEARR